jgi:hypothetical protein
LSKDRHSGHHPKCAWGTSQGVSPLLFGTGNTQR